MSKHGFTEHQLERYARHIILPQIGGKGQRKLLESHVLVAGAGGLGSPVLLYLASAGVGKITIVDYDRVDLSNLQRQIIHSNEEIGNPKVSSAKARLKAINPDIEVITIEEKLTSSNIREVLKGVDVVADGTDNFPARYLINDACYLEGIPLVSGAMFRFEGQLTVFPNDKKPESPCYRCLFPEIPARDSVPTCQQAGVLGVVPGVIGSMQATEVIKVLLGVGEPLVGRLCLYDALEMKFREIKVKRSKSCVLNGDHPTLTALRDETQE